MTKSPKKVELRELLLASASVAALMMHAPALAQETPADEAAVAEAEAEAAQEDTIVVTGSRIRQDEFTSTSPVQIIDPSLGTLQGISDTATLIQSSTVAAGSAQITSAISSAFVTNGGPGAQTVSLRGLGAERTLVLLNGRRAGPAGTRGAVAAFDLNVLPQSIVSTVEVLKDGASSIYGSDAVAGVVNIITKRDTDGIQLDTFYSQPFESGGEELRASATWGKIFNRGHILVSADYYRRWELERGDRDYLACPEEYIFNQDGSRADIIDPRTNSYTCRDTLWGHIWLYDYIYYYSANGSNLIAPNGQPMRRLQFDYAGDNLGSFIPGVPPKNPPGDPFQFEAPAGWFPVGYDAASFAVENAYHPFIDASSFTPRTERYTAYADAAYQLTGWAELYTEFLFNRRITEQDSFRQFWQFGFTENFVPGFGDPFATGFNGAVLLSPTTITDWFGSSQEIDYFRVVGGARGELGGFLDGWNWDVHSQYSRSDGDYTQQQILDDAVSSQDFRTESCVGQTLPISGRPCIDVDWLDPEFLAGNITPEVRAFLFDQETGNTVYTQMTVEGIVTGDVFKLPAGDVAVALGGTWRRDEINDVPGPITLAGNAWGVTSAGITAGVSNTAEAFGEIQIPLIRDVPLIRNLLVQAAGRYTDVDTYGSDFTYKFGASWQVNDWLRFRGTYGTSFRAPALFELFLADQTGFLSQRQVDPCIDWGNNLANGVISQQLADNCAADGVPPNHTGAGISATIITGGGFGILEAETSDAMTLSVVLTPELGDRTSLKIAVDYFEIEVNGEIAQLGAGNIVAGCYNSDFFPNDPLCDLFARGGEGNPNNIDFIRDSFININSQQNTGLDVTIQLDQDMPRGLGTLSLLGQMTWQFTDTIALFEGTEVSVNGEDGEPKWVGDFNIVWRKNKWSLFYGIDAIAGTSDEQDFIDANGTLCPSDAIHGTFCVDLKAEPRVYHSLSLTREFESWKVTLGVANLTDLSPPRVSTNNRGEITTIGQAPFTSNYDYVGRRIFFNVSKTF